MESAFIQLAVILFTAFVVSYVLRALKQPIIIGYVLAGVIVSPFLIKAGASTEMISLFSDFGISFLLFIVGLHLNPKVIKEIGVSSLVVGLGQVVLTFAATYGISRFLLGVDIVTSLYFGVAIAFSSTIIIMKLLSDKKHLDSLYGKISIGVLIIQDLIAVGVLMFISSVSGNSHIAGNLGLERFLTGGALVIGLFFVGYYLLPRILRSVAKSQELLFLFSICWCFILAALFSFLGFSMEIGSLVAGIILSSSNYATEISSKIRPLRDFFLILFFIILGLQIQISNIKQIIVNAVVLSSIALILKPVIIMLFMKGFGYTKRTNFLTGSTLAQISEFSLIVLTLGVTVGHILPEALSTMVLTLVITILFSTYMIIYSKKFYHLSSPLLKFFEKKKSKKGPKRKPKCDTILFGYNRIGFNILKSFKKLKKNYLVVDFNPDTIKNLNRFRIPALYGDVYDSEFLDDLPLDKIELAVSTIPDIETNELMIDVIREKNRKAVIILRAHTIEDALKLYKAGANYVLTPHFLGGEYVAKMIRHAKSGDEDYTDERKKHIKMLKGILKEGHEHPHVD